MGRLAGTALAALLLPGCSLPVRAAADGCLVAVDIGHDRERPAPGARGIAKWHYNAALADSIAQFLRAAQLPALLLWLARDVSGICSS